MCCCVTPAVRRTGELYAYCPRPVRAGVPWRARRLLVIGRWPIDVLGLGRRHPAARRPRSPAASPAPADTNLTVKDALLGGDPGDDLSLGKRHYREKNYGLAEQHFRRAVEKAAARRRRLARARRLLRPAASATISPTAPTARRSTSTGRAPKCSTISATRSCCAATCGARAQKFAEAQAQGPGESHDREQHRAGGQAARAQARA